MREVDVELRLATASIASKHTRRDDTRELQEQGSGHHIPKSWDQ
jgi:hypothetical protein